VHVVRCGTSRPRGRVVTSAATAGVPLPADGSAAEIRAGRPQSSPAENRSNKVSLWAGSRSPARRSVFSARGKRALGDAACTDLVGPGDAVVAWGAGAFGRHQRKRSSWGQVSWQLKRWKRKWSAMRRSSHNFLLGWRTGARAARITANVSVGEFPHPAPKGHHSSTIDGHAHRRGSNGDASLGGEERTGTQRQQAELCQRSAPQLRLGDSKTEDAAKAVVPDMSYGRLCACFSLYLLLSLHNKGPVLAHVKISPDSRTAT
jgi:hypothetical protein